MKNGPTLLAEYLPSEVLGISSSQITKSGVSGTPPAFSLAVANGLEDAVSEFEKSIISHALEKTRGNVLQTAALLKIPRGTLRYKMDKLGL
jgi:DNA-binding NtrC family response regulator